MILRSKKLLLMNCNPFKVTLLAALCCASLLCSAQPDSSVFRIALIVPLQAYSTRGAIEDFQTAKDAFEARRVKLNADAVESMDFYEGFTQALSHSPDSMKFELHVYDCWNSDSITKVILKKPEMRNMNCIIGASSTSNAKLVADYCKLNHIINVQPFSPSKSLTSDNPYHLKLAPTIDSHIDNMFLSIVDSFPGANIIIYTSNTHNDLSVAKRFDSLFGAFNKTALGPKFTSSLLNTSTMMVNGKKTTATELLKPGKKNVWIITSFEESFVNGNFRVMYDKNSKYDIVAYGMPTWLSGDIIRMDYVNEYQTRVTDPFWLDTLNTETRDFISSYSEGYSHPPRQSSYLGYDVGNFIISSIQTNGKNFLSGIATTRYRGLGYVFDIAKNYDRASTSLPDALSETVAPVNFYENRHVNVFRVVDYQLFKVY